MTEALATALRAHLARNETMTLVERLSRDAERDGRTLADVAAEDAVVRTYLSPDEIRRLLTPDNYLGAASIFIERVLRRWSV